MRAVGGTFYLGIFHQDCAGAAVRSAVPAVTTIWYLYPGEMQHEAFWH